MSDIIDTLSPGGPSALRDLRPVARENAQKSFEALLEPAEPGRFTQAERYAVAAYAAGLHGLDLATTFYVDLLDDEAPPALAAAVADATARGRSRGPYGEFREPGLSGRSEPGASISNDSFGLGTRLTAAFDVTHLLVFHPRDSRPGVIRHLAEAGWTADEIVSLTQLVGFLCFQLRVVQGIGALAGAEPPEVPGAADAPQMQWPAAPDPEIARPQRFVNHSLGWTPWVKPVDKVELTEAQVEAMIQPRRADMAYFRLLARDPDALRARTLTDLDIFYNTDGGLGRAEREIAATVTSVFNGCVYCASVHAGRAEEESGRAGDINRLIDDGVRADLGSGQWNALRDAAVSLAATPPRFGAQDVDKLRDAGFDDAAVVDAVNAVAFFSWANRLMLVLGEPELPRRFH